MLERTTGQEIRAALYGRVSTVGHGQDIGLQLDDLRALVRQRGWTVEGEYLDDGVSGNTDTRPALDRLMTSARNGKLDVVVCWRFDRFARSTSHLLQALEEFRLRGVAFVSYQEQIDTTTAIGKVLFTLIAAISEFELALTRERVLAGVRRAQAQGKHCGRPTVAIDLRPAAALLNEGRGLKQVAAILQVNRNTLRRRLREAGEWPRPTAGGQKPPPSNPA
mgnify:CR=1 FL=1